MTEYAPGEDEPAQRDASGGLAPDPGTEEADRQPSGDETPTEPPAEEQGTGS
jgi:hypothetical protein